MLFLEQLLEQIDVAGGILADQGADVSLRNIWLIKVLVRYWLG